MKKKLVALTACAGMVAGGLAVVAGPAQAAAPASCTGTAASIYTSPASIPSTSGELISCRPVTLTEITDGPAINAWQVQYASKDVAGEPIAVSGTIIVPKAKWSRSGTRPVIAYASGTLGSGPQCAMSKQLAGGYQDMYEGANLGSFLSAGFAVAQTDGVGFLNGQIHTYVVGENAGHALLDGTRAAFQVPGAGLEKKTKVGISGYSEGGHSSLWGAQLAKSYAPDLNVVGAAAGGVPGDLKLTAASLNGSGFAGFLADAAIGQKAAFPALPFDELLNQSGTDAVAKAKTLCLLGTLASFPFNTLGGYMTVNRSLEQIYALKGTDGVSWGQRLDQSKVGVGVGTQAGAKYQIGFPVFQYRAFFDEIINVKAEEYARDSYCKAGVRVKWQQYPGEHLSADLQASQDVTKWFTDRFTSIIPEFGNC